MLRRHVNLAMEMGMDRRNIILPEIGNVIELTTKTIKVADAPAPSGEVLVDGSGVGDVGSVVLRDRKILAEDGMVVLILNIQKRPADHRSRGHHPGLHLRQGVRGADAGAEGGGQKTPPSPSSASAAGTWASSGAR